MNESEETTLLESFAPSADALFHRLCKAFDDDLLWDLAHTDQGFHLHEYLVELRRMRNTGRLPQPLRWMPREVLELAGWSRPDHPDELPAYRGKRGHLIRAFGCAALLRAEPDGHRDACDVNSGSNTRLACLLESLDHLDDGLTIPAQQFVAWRLGRRWPDAYDPDRINREEWEFFIFGLLFLELRLNPASNPRRMHELIDWLLDVENVDECSEIDESGLLFRFTSSLRFDVWTRFAAEAAASAEAVPDAVLRARIQDTAVRIIGPA